MNLTHTATVNRAGFTLIELSIVLVIIGLVVGGVMVGKDLIEAATIRSQISQIEKYNTAANTFKVKYGGLPGDITVAQANQFGLYVNPACGFGLVCMDGNGRILDYTGSCSTAGNIGSNIALGCVLDTIGEPIIFFKHLTDSGMLAGSVVGTDNPSWDSSNIYIPLKVGRGGVIATSGYSGGNWYFLGAGTLPVVQDAWLNDNATQGALSPIVAQMIDSKIDDGLPNTGNVRAAYVLTTWGIYLDNAKTTCTTTDGSGTVQYSVSNLSLACQLMVKGSF